MEEFECDNCGEIIEFSHGEIKVNCPNCLVFYNLYEVKNGR